MKNFAREELVDSGEISLVYTEQSGHILKGNKFSAFSFDQAVIQISRTSRWV
jgi:hypothetical protein